MPIPEFAYKLCGERQDPELLVFPGLPDPSWISRPLRRWIESAGITRNITFHCLRHSCAVLLLTLGADIYTVSKILGHRSVRATQVYAKIVDKKKDDAITLVDDAFSPTVRNPIISTSMLTENAVTSS